jgi:peptidoglycan/xylan/chitin deacetylase (PgdA/CDA1 family)
MGQDSEIVASYVEVNQEATRMQVFLDATGKRSVKVNWILSITVVLFFSLLAFITVHTVRLHLIELHAQTPSEQSEDSRTDSAAMFYVDNHGQAYSTLQDKIESIDTLIVPTYLLTETGILTDPAYEVLHKDIDFLTLTKATNYTLYHHMSTKSYSDLPLDRTSANDSTTYSQLLKDTELIAIRDSLLAAEALGLIIELDIKATGDTFLSDEMVRWFEGARNLLQEEGLELGVHLTLEPGIEDATNFVGLSDVVYLSLSHKDPIAPQLERLSLMDDSLQDDVIVELPTVTSESNLSNEYDYVKSIAYSSVAELLLGQELNERTVEPAELTDDNKSYRIFDAVSAYNIMQTVGEELGSKKLQYSIGSPGYEEYTLWSLLTEQLDPAEQQQIIERSVMSSRGIEQAGQGKVYQLDDAGSFGRRSISVDEKTNLITSSTKEEKNSPARITRSGYKSSAVALTFDDGPHPVYTAKVMDILEKYGVKGTFFVVGEKVSDHPEVAREIVRRGHQIENHTYSHAAISHLDKDMAVAEIESTSNMIELISGQPVQYFRRPYSGSDTFSSWGDVAYLQLLDELGLQASEYDIDSKDWQLGSADEIYQKVKTDIDGAPEGVFSQVLLHDSHQTPELTLEALPMIIEHFQKDNVALVRVDELADASMGIVRISTTFAALTSRDILIQGFVFLNIGFIGFSVAKYAWMVIGTVVYSSERRRTRRKLRSISPNRLFRPTLAVIISCYNEEKVIGKTIRSLQASSYKNIRIVIINDGSTDYTARVVKNYARKDSRIKLITRPNQGKAHALNFGVSQVQG